MTAVMLFFTGNPQYSVFGDEMICLSDFFSGWLSLVVIVALQLIFSSAVFEENVEVLS